MYMSNWMPIYTSIFPYRHCGMYILVYIGYTHARNKFPGPHEDTEHNVHEHELFRHLRSMRTYTARAFGVQATHTHTRAQLDDTHARWAREIQRQTAQTHTDTLGRKKKHPDFRFGLNERGRAPREIDRSVLCVRGRVSIVPSCPPTYTFFSIGAHAPAYAPAPAAASNLLARAHSAKVMG